MREHLTLPSKLKQDTFSQFQFIMFGQQKLVTPIKSFANTERDSPIYATRLYNCETQQMCVRGGQTWQLYSLILFFFGETEKVNDAISSKILRPS